MQAEIPSSNKKFMYIKMRLVIRTCKRTWLCGEPFWPHERVNIMPSNHIDKMLNAQVGREWNYRANSWDFILQYMIAILQIWLTKIISRCICRMHPSSRNYETATGVVAELGILSATGVRLWAKEEPGGLEGGKGASIITEKCVLACHLQGCHIEERRTAKKLKTKVV